MQANRAEVRTLTAADLPDLDPARLGLKGSPTKVKKTFVPPVHSTGVRVEGKDAGEQADKFIKSCCLKLRSHLGRGQSYE